MAEAGRYRVSLRRYPQESGLALDASAPVPPTEPGVEPYPLGKPLSIQKATIKVGGVEKEMAVETRSESVDFEVDLPAGDTSLYTSFTDEQGQQQGAFYAYISKLR